MVLPAQFQLGLELTNVLNPFSQAVSALGSLALVDAIKKSGSDVITEIKLASLIGRHRIDPIIEFHFRTAVSKPDQSIISRYMDIVLESGAGPTVQEALKHPALFSMVVQLSGLAFAHEDESLANALVSAIENNVREKGEGEDFIPDYVSLLGTLRACQQQTAAFRWASLYEDVERKIHAAVNTSEPGESRANGTKNRESKKQGRVLPTSVRQRSLPFSVLQGILKCLQSQTLYRFPNESLLHLRCDSGISTVVVWCHHILGLELAVRISGHEICFGSAPSNLIVEETCDVPDVGACLMEPKHQHEPLFTLKSDDQDQSLSSESRAEAFGYGREVIRSAWMSDDEARFCYHWIIARTLRFVLSRTASVLKASHTHFEKDPIDIEFYWTHPRTSLSKDRILRASKFMFGVDDLDMKEIEIQIRRGTVKPPPRYQSVVQRMPTESLTAILITFATIEESDLQKCASMPLVTRVSIWDRRSLEMILRRNTKVSEENDLPLVSAFHNLAMLLLGYTFSRDHVTSAALLSAWGWSIFFDSLHAKDPQDVSVNSMRVVCGVPARHGLRRNRIIDGPEETRWSPPQSEQIEKTPALKFFTGLSRAKMGSTLVGVHADAFQVTQIISWTGRTPKIKIKMGFRRMQEMCLRIGRPPPCHCDKNEPDYLPWVQSSENVAAGSVSPEIKWSISRRGYTDTEHKETVLRLDHSRPEFKNRKVFAIDVGLSSAAKWMQLAALAKTCDPSVYSLFMRRRDTCNKCALLSDEVWNKEHVLILL